MKLCGNHLNERRYNGDSLRLMRDEINPSSTTIVIYNGYHVLSIVRTRMIIRFTEIHMNEFKG